MASGRDHAVPSCCLPKIGSAPMSRGSALIAYVAAQSYPGSAVVNRTAEARNIAAVVVAPPSTSSAAVALLRTRAAAVAPSSYAAVAAQSTSVAAASLSTRAAHCSPSADDCCSLAQRPGNSPSS